MSQTLCSIRFRLWPLALVLALFSLLAGIGCATARAEESVQLANGFIMRCDHHALVNGQMRLYPHADNAEFIDLAPSSVLGFRRQATAITPPDPEAAPKTPMQLRPPDLRPILASAGREHNLDVDLLASIVQAESANHPNAVSRTGAKGLMQLMPATAHDLGVQDSFAPSENVHGGAAYLDELLTRYHDDLALALAAYNAGPATVDRYHGIPPYRETQLYVARVIHLFNQRVAERNRRPASNQATMLHPQ